MPKEHYLTNKKKTQNQYSLEVTIFWNLNNIVIGTLGPNLEIGQELDQELDLNPKKPTIWKLNSRRGKGPHQGVEISYW